MSFHMYVPTRIFFGSGQFKELYKRELPGTKAMIVISNGRQNHRAGYAEMEYPARSGGNSQKRPS